MIIRDKLYIGGAWTPSSGSEMADIINSTTEEVMGRVPRGTAEDVDRAVRAAKDAFPAWSQTPVAERAAYLQKVADLLEARREAIGEVIAREVGMPIRLSQIIQVGQPLATFSALPSILAEFPFEERIGNSLVVREPIGVVGCITPWNYPLHQIAAKVAPALAAGCTVVLKPSEVAPLNAFMLADIFAEIGLPAGVFNLVSGRGSVVGEALALHPDVDMISFTGSTNAGRRVSELASRTVKPVALELGGKSPNILLDDADLETAVRDGVGQVLPQFGADMQRADAHAGSALEAGGGRRDRQAVGGVVHARRSVYEGHATGAARLRRAAGDGRQLHPQGRAGGRAAGDGWRGAARGAGERLLRPPDGLLQCDERYGDCPGGNLRASAGHHAL